MRAMRHRLAVALMYVLVTGTSVAGEIVRVAINDLAFSPADVTAKVGDTIEWVNGDFVDHTATDKGGAWDVAIAAGNTAQLALTSAGTRATRKTRKPSCRRPSRR
jgi:plastocyanin